MVLVLLFDWNWLRPPLERDISHKTQRTFRIDDMNVRLGFTPTIRLRNLYFGNASWSKEEAMAKAEQVEFSISLRDLPGKILITRVALTRPDFVFEKLKDERKNWILSDPSDTSPSRLSISTLSVDHGRLRYVDHGEPFELEVNGSTFDPAVEAKVKDADAAPTNNRYSTQYTFAGKYHGAAFSGTALTGEVLSFQESGVPFPLKRDLQAGTTRVRVEGTIADAADISGIDTQLRISKLLKLTDLGPLIGVQTKASGGKPAVSQGESSSRLAAKAKEKQVDPDHILPAGSFDGSRLQKIDADVDLEAGKLEVPNAWPFESIRASLHLHDAVLKLTPLDFGFAGGTIASNIELDARQPTITSNLQVNLQRVKIAELLLKQATIARGAGLLGGALQLKGTGNSIADAAAKADGSIKLAVVDGQISNLVDALSGLNGAKVIQLLVTGDKTIAVNCGGVAFDVAGGQGTSKLMVIDTQDTQILGSGSFDLAQERFDITIAPKPKNMGILSLRTPVRAYGTFKRPDFQTEKGPLLLRAGGAVALAAAAPLAALVPLVETGPGSATNCGAV